MIPIPFAGFSDPVSSWSHLIAALCAAVGTVALLMKGRGNRSRVTALVIYGIGLIFLFSMSGVFHLLARKTEARDVLQRLDHAGIWVLIAATFSPIHVILFRRHWRWASLAGIWTVALTGMVLEMIFFKNFPESVLVSMFLSLGWMGAFSAYGFRRVYSDRSITLLIAGAIFYTIGAIIDFVNWPTFVEGILGPHEIFHFFVIAGAAAHWLFIYQWSAHPVNNEILFNVRVSPDQVIAEANGELIRLEAKSESEIKELIKLAISRKFHARIQPIVRLRYFREEVIDMTSKT